MPIKTGFPPEFFIPAPDTDVNDVDASLLGVTFAVSASGLRVKKSPGSYFRLDSLIRLVFTQPEEFVAGPLELRLVTILEACVL